MSDLAEEAAAPPCREERRIQVSGDGGDVGGDYLIFFAERGTATDCWANQVRITQEDGSVGAWLTTGVECYSYAANVAHLENLPSTKSSTGAQTPTLAFTLASTSAGAPQIIRRGKYAGPEEKDVISINDNTSADEFAGALTQLAAKAGSQRSFNDVTEAVGSVKSKGAGKQRASYEKLLHALQQARHANVKGIGDAPALNVIAIL